jgi:hypothetical protein
MNRLPLRLTTEEEAMLLERLQAGDKTVHKPLIEHNLRLLVYNRPQFEKHRYQHRRPDIHWHHGLIKAGKTLLIPIKRSNWPHMPPAVLKTKY